MFKIYEECVDTKYPNIQTLTMVSCLLLGLAILTGLIFLPILLKHVKGPRRILMVLQQICIIGYLSLMTVFMIFMMKPTGQDWIKSILWRDGTKLRSLGIGLHLLEFWKYFFYFAYYCFSLMQTIDLHCMICQPFRYETFAKTKNVVKLALAGTGVCLLLSIESLVRMFFVWHVRKVSLSVTYSVHYYFGIIRVITVVKFGIAKLTYTLFAGKLALEIKTKLAEMSALSTNQDRSSTNIALFRFNLIPLIVNIFLLGHDIPLLIILFMNKGRNCSMKPLEPIFIIVSAVSFTVTSFSYSVGYISLFPKIRSAFKWKRCCAGSNDVGNDGTDQ